MSARKDRGQSMEATAMVQGRLLRTALMASAMFNLGGVALFSMPASFPSQLAGLPTEVPAIYRYLTALFMLLFGAAYAWLSSRECVERPLVVFGIIGKIAAFSLMMALWMTDQIATRTLVTISGDLVFALLFVAGLRSSETYQ